MRIDCYMLVRAGGAAAAPPLLYEDDGAGGQDSPNRCVALPKAQMVKEKLCADEKEKKRQRQPLRSILGARSRAYSPIIGIHDPAITIKHAHALPLWRLLPTPIHLLPLQHKLHAAPQCPVLIRVLCVQEAEQGPTGLHNFAAPADRRRPLPPHAGVKAFTPPSVLFVLLRDEELARPPHRL